jgi:hypothetical protein
MADINTGSMTATTLQKAARAVAVVFVAVGVLGFIPGITTDYGTMNSAVHDSVAKLLGIFQLSMLHNIVGLLFGIVGLALARSFSGARAYLIGGGVVYAVLWVYGLVVADMSSANFVPMNTADDWLHLLLAVGMISLGVLLGREAVRSSTQRPR